MQTARAETPQPQTTRAAGMFRALSHRNYRLFWTGAFLSNTGTWMQTVAQSLLVFQLTQSGTWLGADSFMATVPGLLLTLVGGVIADTVDRKRLLIFTQSCAGLSALTLSVLVWAGVVKVWMILALSFATGCCWAISGPSYQAITVELVEREDLANAIALNSSQFQLARVIGPMLAGVTMQLLGLAGCFFANGLSYVAIVTALARVRLPKKERAGVGSRAIWRDLLEGFSYVRGRPRVGVVLMCSTVVSLFGTPYLVLMPMFAHNIYGWGGAGLSLLMGTAGAGALCGAVFLAYLGDFRRKGLLLLGTLFSGGACITAFASVARPAAALPLLFGVGCSTVCFFAVGNTLLQQLVTDRMRGRVMSMWLLTFIGTMPLGSLVSGRAADYFGPSRTLAACGLTIFLFALVVAARNPRLREI
ncbi:MAG TPA: MFS transporter [Pyrinomonadaceae bacterium]|nr:MFS transporter [Pyrinomonadaceae bacterium]